PGASGHVGRSLRANMVTCHVGRSAPCDRWQIETATPRQPVHIAKLQGAPSNAPPDRGPHTRHDGCTHDATWSGGRRGVVPAQVPMATAGRGPADQARLVWRASALLFAVVN